MKKSKLSRFVVNHNSDTNVLTLVCTKDLVVKFNEVFHKICHTEYLSAERTIENSWNEDGDLFENCAVIKFNVNADVVDVFFDAAKTFLRQRISESINHIEN